MLLCKIYVASDDYQRFFRYFVQLLFECYFIYDITTVFKTFDSYSSQFLGVEIVGFAFKQCNPSSKTNQKYDLSQ